MNDADASGHRPSRTTGWARKSAAVTWAQGPERWPPRVSPVASEGLWWGADTLQPEPVLCFAGRAFCFPFALYLPPEKFQACLWGSCSICWGIRASFLAEVGSDQPHRPWRRSPRQIPGGKRAGAAAADSFLSRWGEGAKVTPGAPSDAEPVYWGGLVSFLKGLWWWLFGKWMAVCCEQFFPVWRRRGWNKPSKKEPGGIRFLTLCAAVTFLLVSVLSHGQRTLATTCMCENSST